MYSMSRATRVYRTTFKLDPLPDPTAPKGVRGYYDWERMRKDAAEEGTIPPPPYVDKSREKQLARIQLLIEASDRRGLIRLKIGDFNSTVRSLGKWRDICVIALATRARQTVV